jgi:hypothetical protein
MAGVQAERTSLAATGLTVWTRWKYSLRSSQGTPRAFKMRRFVACRHARPFSIA